MSNNKYDEIRNNFYNLVQKISGQKLSGRNLNKLEKEYNLSKDLISSFITSTKTLDFYPTPTDCLNNDYIFNVINESKNILEPTYGVGNIINFIHNVNPEVDITGYELSTDLYNKKLISPIDKIELEDKIKKKEKVKAKKEKISKSSYTPQISKESDFKSYTYNQLMEYLDYKKYYYNQAKDKTKKDLIQRALDKWKPYAKFKKYKKSELQKIASDYNIVVGKKALKLDLINEIIKAIDNKPKEEKQIEEITNLIKNKPKLYNPELDKYIEEFEKQKQLIEEYLKNIKMEKEQPKRSLGSRSSLKRLNEQQENDFENEHKRIAEEGARLLEEQMRQEEEELKIRRAKKAVLENLDKLQLIKILEDNGHKVKMSQRFSKPKLIKRILEANL